MAVAKTSNLKTRDIKPKIGTEILCDKEMLLSGVHAAELRDLLEQRGVLVFPKVNFTNEEQVAFTGTLGKLARDVGAGDIYKISLDKEKTPSADILKGAFYWHIDGTMQPKPILASILCSKVLAPTGGNTEFSNTYAAYDDLSEEKKAEIEGLRVKHSAWTSLYYYDPEPSQEKLDEMMAVGEIELPLVWEHRSGRKSLILGCTAHHVIDMNWTESARLLNSLRDWATSEPFHYSHEWSVGDAVMWDNTGTLHRATAYPLECNRELHRTKLEGEEPIAA